jgi:hypothetical protein
LLLSTVIALPAAGLAAFSQTISWYGDEEYHLLAAQLIDAGKRPYVDFFYNHTPLYIYLTAAWMQLFGETWRSAHAFSALASAGALLLAAGFVRSALPEPGWSAAGAIAAALMIGLNGIVTRFGTIGQAYGLCCLLIVAAFRLAIEAANREKAAWAFLAGASSGAAAASSLLSAPAAPVLWFWMMRHNQAGSRGKKTLSFFMGMAVPFAPLVRLAALAPRQVVFSLLQYHLSQRAGSMRSSARWNIHVLAGWMESTQGVALALLAGIGLLFLAGRRDWDPRRKAPFRLCAWLAAVFGLWLAIPYPTHPQYFILLVPFLSILASLGVCAVGLNIWKPRNPLWLVLPVAALFAAGLVRSVHALSPEYRSRWQRIEKIAREVNAVAPASGALWADEGIYFAARRQPPAGLENAFALDMRVSAPEAAALHVVLRPQLNRWIAAGRFDAVASCWADQQWIDSLGLARVYARRKDLDHCCVFWDPTPALRGRASE